MVPYSAIKHIHEENQKFVLGLRLSPEEIEALRQRALERLRRQKEANDGGPSKEELREAQLKRLDDAEQRLIMEQKRLKAELERQTELFDKKSRMTRDLEKKKVTLAESIKNLQQAYAKLAKELERLLEEEEFLRKTIAIEDEKIAKIRRAVAFSTTTFAYLMQDKVKLNLQKRPEDEEVVETRQALHRFEKRTGKGFKKPKQRPAWQSQSLQGMPRAKTAPATGGRGMPQSQSVGALPPNQQTPMGAQQEEKRPESASALKREPPKEVAWNNVRMNRSVRRVLSNGTLPFSSSSGRIAGGQLFPVSTGQRSPFDYSTRSTPSLRKTPGSLRTTLKSASASSSASRAQMDSIKRAW